MGYPRLTGVQKTQLLALVREGWTVKAAAGEAGMSYSSARGLLRGLENSSGGAWRAARLGGKAPEPVAVGRLKAEAARGLEEFEFWRLRYTGHVSTRWQVETAQQILELFRSGEREFVVENVAPGLGKSTLLVDIGGWLTCRDRTVRGLFISRANVLAVQNVLRVRRFLERTSPMRAKAADRESGVAVDAVATVAQDYGRFKPDSGEVWRREEFVVYQADGQPIEEKEPTWSAFGFDSEWIGLRFDLMLGDDLDSGRSTRNFETVVNNRRIFDEELEPRLEPGGLLVVCQQRLGPNDFSRHCLDKRLVPDGDGEADEPQYRHIVYKTHYLDRCTGDHRHVPAWPEGCLLDPQRVSFKDVRKLMGNKSRFEVVYQQEDVDPAGALVAKVWVDGGRGSDGVDYPGCWDDWRGACQLPENLEGPLLSVVTADPSPTKMWSVQWWVYQPATEQRFLMDLARQAMDAPDFLEHDPRQRRFTGLLEEWWLRSNDLGLPFRWLIVEENAAQRFMLQYSFFKQWAAQRAVAIIPHATHRNKLSSEFGVQASLAPVWRLGRVRLPGRQMDPGRLASMKLVDEVTRWPGATTDDCVMAEWFFEYHLQNIAVVDRSKEPKLWRPSWLRQPSLAS